MGREILETKRKALKLNLDGPVYGTFAEIGAGQEVARNFLRQVRHPALLLKPCRPTIWHLVMLFTEWKKVAVM